MQESINLHTQTRLPILSLHVSFQVNKLGTAVCGTVYAMSRANTNCGNRLVLANSTSNFCYDCRHGNISLVPRA